MRDAILVAGGFGTRLRHVVPDVPKPMAPVSGRPFLEILLSELSRKGFHRVVLSLGFMADKIISHFGRRFSGMDLIYAVEDHPLGTGGAVRLAMSHCQEEHVFVFNGDTFLDLNSVAVEQHWRQNHRPIIVGCQVPDTARYGRLLSSNGRVTGFTEKGLSGPGLINAGCYVLHQGQLDHFQLNKPFSLESDYLVKAILDRSFDVFITTGRFIDIGVPADYFRAQIDLRGYC